MTFLLTGPPFDYSLSQIGLVGLAGLAGALAAGGGPAARPRAVGPGDRCLLVLGVLSLLLAGLGSGTSSSCWSRSCSSTWPCRAR